MKALSWILTAALLMTMLAYTVVKERPAACHVPQLSQVLR
jgi:hypothetical protein